MVLVANPARNMCSVPALMRECLVGGVPLYGRPILPYNRCEQANRPKERSLSLESLILAVNDHPGRRPAQLATGRSTPTNA